MKTVYQAYNNKINAWVKYKLIKGAGARIIEVKQREPQTPFANIPVR